MKQIEDILKKHMYKGSAIIQVLTDIQEKFNYLPRENLEYVSQRLKVPLSKIYSIATFYAAFSLNPRGKHLITVCKGTACFVRGVSNVLNRIESRLKITSGCTTEDNMFTLETVNCLGACGLAPVVVINEKVYPQMTPESICSVIDELKEGKK